jgi:hypothetical protein
LSIAGSALAAILNMRTGRRVRSPSAAATTKRISLTWLLLAVYCLAAIAVAWPLDGKQMTAFIVLFVLIGWLTMALQLFFTPIWPGLIVIALLLGGYFLLPEYFYLWVGLLGGGGMIVLGVYIRSRW